jgi:hypothetical protein
MFRYEGVNSRKVGEFRPNFLSADSADTSTRMRLELKRLSPKVTGWPGFVSQLGENLPLPHLMHNGNQPPTQSLQRELFTRRQSYSCKDHSSAFTSDVKNSWSFTSTLFYVFKARILVTSGAILLFTRNDLRVTIGFQEDRIAVMIRALYPKTKLYFALFFISG